MSPTPPPEELLALATDIASQAAQLIARFATTGFGVDTKSTRTDMVTDADQGSQSLIERLIREARPDDGWLGEEGAARPGTSGVRWVFDPLDGTTNFVYRIPAFAVSIGIEVNGKVVAGVVHDVAHGQTFTASLGKGARLNGASIAISGKVDLGTALLATGFGYDPSRRAEQGAMLARVLPNIRDIRRGGSAALDLCHVASGQLDGYFEYRLNPWDIAAGGIIAREAGAATGGFGGHTFEDGYVIACAPGLLPEATALVERAYAEARGL